MIFNNKFGFIKFDLVQEKGINSQKEWQKL